ncbi:MAG: hypothetical protein ACP5MD_02030 [Verrucomicrobiia bacterium]
MTTWLIRLQGDTEGDALASSGDTSPLMDMAGDPFTTVEGGIKNGAPTAGLSWRILMQS